MSTRKKEIVNKVNVQIVVQSLSKKAERVFKALSNVKAIRSQEDFDTAGIAVKELKNYAKLAKEEELKITKPLTEALEATRIHFRPFFNRVNEAELAIKELMSTYLLSNKKKIELLEEKVANGEIKNISTFVNKVAKLTTENNAASIRKVWKAVITNEKLIPREFLVPDTAKIVEHCKKGGTLPGVEWKQVESIAI